VDKAFGASKKLSGNQEREQLLFEGYLKIVDSLKI